MLVEILIGVAVVVVVLIAIVALLPSAFRVERKTTMSAPAAAVFAQVNDFHNWGAWSPWAKIDPAMKLTFSGAPAGTGAIYSWTGNSDVGSGRMTITESKPNEHIHIKLEFFRPFKATNAAEFIFRQEGGQTELSWSMTGKKNFIIKGFSLFMSMDKMVGGQFEKGLSGIKSIVEAAPR
jgi:hypothetical protein